MWYWGYILAVFALAAWGRPRDRSAWTVIAAASLASVGLGLWLDAVDAAWKLPIYGALELATLAALVRWASGPILRPLAALTAAAWAAHAALFFDLITGASLIYDHYAAAIVSIAILQLALGASSLRHVADSLRDAIARRASGPALASAATARAGAAVPCRVSHFQKGPTLPLP